MAHCRKANRGQIIVEVMVALSVVTISFTGFFGLLRSAISMTSYVADNYRATYLAAEGMEVVKNMLDRNFVERDTRAFNQDLADGSYEVEPGSTALMPVNGALRRLAFDGSEYSYDNGGDETPFTREIVIKNMGDYIFVRSTVKWSVKGMPFTIELADKFYYWWSTANINSQPI